MIESPIFLVGAERSGTTLLRLLLDHHPEVAFGPEFVYSVERVSDDGRFPDMREYHDYLTTNRIARTSGLQVDRSLDYPQLIDSFLVQRREASGKPIVGATVHKSFDRLLHIWPDARFIHMLRDGRDVARSRIAIGWNGNMWEASHRWIEAEELWDSLEQRLPQHRHLTVRYERLVQEPEQCLTEVCRFIGTQFDPKMLEIDQDTTYARPNPNLASQWRERLSPYEIRLAESRMGPMLERRGYPLSGLPSLDCGPVRRAFLGLHNRWKKLGFRRRRYGAKLVVLDAISRRIGPEQFRRWVSLQVDGITLRNLK